MISFNHVPEEVSHFYKWELNSAQFIIIPATESSSEASSLLDKEALIALCQNCSGPPISRQAKASSSDFRVLFFIVKFN
jgi:hypothetical protein